MGNNKNPNQKQPGEKESGTFHYNPGNMSGKTIGISNKVKISKTTEISKDESEKRANGDRIKDQKR
jgi:hypothetical protein